MATPGRYVAVVVERAFRTRAASLLIFAFRWLGSSARADQTLRRAFGHAARGAFLFALATALAWLATIEAIAEDRRQPNVLIVYSNDPELPAVQLISRGLRSGFSQNSAVRLYTEYFDEVRFPHNWTSGNFARYLRNKYRELKIDLMIGVSDDAVALLRTERSTLAPEAPIVFNSVSPRTPAIADLPNSTGIYSHFDIMRVFELARRLLPGARDIIVVTGAAAFDRSWEKTAREALKSLKDDYRLGCLLGFPSASCWKKSKHCRRMPS